MGQCKNTMDLFIDACSKLFWPLCSPSLLSCFPNYIFSVLVPFCINIYFSVLVPIFSVLVLWIPVAYSESQLGRHEERPAGSTQGHSVTSMLPHWACAHGRWQLYTGKLSNTCSADYFYQVLKSSKIRSHVVQGLVVNVSSQRDTWKNQLLIPAIYGIMTSVLLSPCGATRLCTSALAGAYRAWDSSLASFPSGPKMQADIPCRLPPNQLPRQKARFPIKWRTAPSQEHLIVGSFHIIALHTLKSNNKKKWWGHAHSGRTFYFLKTFCCLASPKWLSHLQVQRPESGLDVSSNVVQ